MNANRQETYTAAQNLINRGTRFGRVVLFRHLGGITRQPEATTGYPSENEWQADLFGILRTGKTCDEAILNWAKAAEVNTPRRATDCRPDCPYNGAGPAPEPTATPAA